MKYLIVKCVELGDQWECDADRVPMYMTDDWESNMPKDYRFEVYEVQTNGTLEKIKDYDFPMESGMVWGYYDNIRSNNFHILTKYKDRTREDKIPKKIRTILREETDCVEVSSSWVRSSGYISGIAEKDDKFYVYGEYSDNIMPIGY